MKPPDRTESSILIERVPVCIRCRRLASVCFADPCYQYVIDGTYTVVRPELPEPTNGR